MHGKYENVKIIGIMVMPQPALQCCVLIKDDLNPHTPF